MAVRTKLLSGRNINTDSDFSKYIETVSEPGVIEGLEVSENSVAIGKCWCPCERTNGETIYALVENFNEVTIDTSGTGYVIVSISQTYIDDGSLINEDGTGVATISVVNELPIKNYLELAELDSGTITDSRNIIKKVGELNTAIESLSSQVADLDERVEALEEAGAIDHLEDQGIVGELYNTDDILFKQKTPALDDCILEDCHVGDTSSNTEIHIQRIASGVEGNKLKLKVKAVGEPTTNLKVEVREGIPVTVTANVEAYWYGDESNILATGTLSSSNFSTTFAEKEFTLSNSINIDEGTLLDIVVYQENSGTKIVNASNYYILACDCTQYSEALSFISVNGNTRSRSKLMPYCIGDCFLQSVLSKVDDSSLSVNSFTQIIVEENTTVQFPYVPGGDFSPLTKNIFEYTMKDAGSLYLEIKAPSSFNAVSYNERLYYNDELLLESTNNTSASSTKNAVAGDKIKILANTGYTYGISGTFYMKLALTRVAIYKDFDKKLKQNQSKGLGQILTCRSFGRLRDGSWRDGN